MVYITNENVEIDQMAWSESLTTVKIKAITAYDEPVFNFGIKSVNIFRNVFIYFGIYKSKFSNTKSLQDNKIHSIGVLVFYKKNWILILVLLRNNILEVFSLPPSLPWLICLLNTQKTLFTFCLYR